MQKMLNTELSMRSRVGYTALLLVGLGGAGLVGSLLLTEPSLVARTQVAFAVLLGINVSWAAYAAWVLTTRRVLLAGHRIIAGRMAVVFSALFVAGMTAVRLYAATIFGALLLIVAIAMLVRARRQFARLMERRRTLERSLAMGCVLVLFAFGAGADVLLTEHAVRVPEIRGTEGTIELAVVRAMRSEKPSRNAHVILAGGPGDSGVNLVRGIARNAEMLELLGEDVIGIDQRGTGKSSPSLSVQRPYGLPLDQPGSPELWLPLIERACRQVAAQFAERGIRLEAYNTRESADDVEDVRRALGYERLTVWGRSYGSHLALAFLRRHPKSIVRVVLANPEGPDDTFKLPSHVDAVLARHDVGVMRTVLARLEQSPVTVDGVVIGKFDLQLLTAQALGDSRTASTIDAAYAEMAKGNFQRIAPLVRAQRSRMGVQSAMKMMMDLSSGATAVRRARIEREAAESLLGNAINFPAMSLASAWGKPDLGDDFRAPVRSDVPVLVLAGELDPRTPAANGREIVKHLPNGKLVVISGGRHAFDIFGSEEIRAMLREFLRPR
jgi:pimeloyl-ACP methyl ester carboxylesterase